MDWDAIKAFYLDCRSFKATAEHFGVPVNSVKTRARRDGWRVQNASEGSAGVQREPSALSAGVQGEPSRDADEPPATNPEPSEGSRGVQSEPSTAAVEPSAMNPEPSPEPQRVQGSVFAAEVTTYPNAMSPGSPAVDTIASVLDAIQSGQFRAEIEELRRVLGRDGKTAYDRAKTRLPAFCVSVGSSRVDLQACKLEYSIVSPK